jgi:protein O-GlcNAc transferase
MAYHGLGRLGDAAEAFQEALAVDPRAADAHSMLGLVREAEGGHERALAAYNTALDCDPSHYAARLNRGALLLALDQAASALQDFDDLVASHPVPQVHNNRARALFALFRDADALTAARAALGIDANDARARLDEAIALASLGRLRESADSLAAFRRLPESSRRRVIPSLPAESRLEPRAVYISRMMQRQSVADWTCRAALIEELRKALHSEESATVLGDPALIQHAIGLPLGSAELSRLADIALAQAQALGAQISARIQPIAAHEPRGRIRVGFLAASLRRHPEAYLIRRLFADRDRSQFEYFLYALNRSDGSAIRRELEASADRFDDLSGVPTDTVVSRIRFDTLDLLVDLSGVYDSARPEAVAARLAPVQLAYLATPSMLAGLHDYRLSDGLTTPPATQAHWRERLVLLPEIFHVYDDSQAHDAQGERRDHGLPDQGRVLCAMHQTFKIGPEVFGTWARVLSIAPNAVLWLLDGGPVANENLRRAARQSGISPDRLVFAPRVPLESHLGRLRHADLFLDTLHCGAHTTALDALWAGVPLVTCEGETMQSRIAASALRACGLGEFVAPSMQDYEQLIAGLATDGARLAAARSKASAARAAAPFRTADRVRAVERAFAEVVRRHRAGLAPTTLLID